MKFSESLKKNRDFQSVYRKGKPYQQVPCNVSPGANHLGRNRCVGISVKACNSIIRHHLTRLIRESYRLHEEQFQCGYDIVIIARTTAKDRSYHEIESALIHLANFITFIRTAISQFSISRRRIYTTRH